MSSADEPAAPTQADDRPYGAARRPIPAAVSDVERLLAQLGDEHRWIRQAIAYEDDYERRDGCWYFARRNHLLCYGAAEDKSPLEQAPANWPRSAVGRGTVPQDWPTWRKYWSVAGD
jgi:hypothetical protein